MVASAEQGYAKEWQDAVLEDAAAHAAAHGLDTPFRPPKSWRVERQSVPRRFREMTSDHTWQRLDTVAKAAAIVELPGKASYPIDPADVKKYIHLLHLKDQKHALLGPGGSRQNGASLPPARLRVPLRGPRAPPPAGAQGRGAQARDRLPGHRDAGCGAVEEAGVP
jgi:hypothetical protein